MEMERQYSFEGRKVSESKAKEIVTSSATQPILELIKCGDISGEFPLTLDEWEILPYLNFDRRDIVYQLEVIWSLTEWEKEYLVDLNTVLENRRHRSMILPFDLNRLKDTGDVRFNEFMDSWDVLVKRSGGPEILVNNRINEFALNEVLGSVNLFEEEEVNIDDLYSRVIEHRNIPLIEDKELSLNREEARRKLDYLLVKPVDIEKIKTMSLDKYNGATRGMINGLFKLSMTFDRVTYLQYKSAWDLRVLANNLKQNNVLTKSNQKKSKNKKSARNSEIETIGYLFKNVRRMPTFEFPFDLENWMKMGHKLRTVEEEVVIDNSAIKKLRTSLPEYADFLFNKVAKFDSETFQNHKASWESAQKQWIERSQHGIGTKSNLRTSSAKEGRAINYSYGNDGIVDKISVEKRIVAQPPVTRKRKVKIVATTGAAGIIGGKKPEPVSKPKSKKKQENKSSIVAKKSGKKKKNSKKSTATTMAERAMSSYTPMRRVSAHVRDNLFYSDNSHYDY